MDPTNRSHPMAHMACSDSCMTHAFICVTWLVHMSDTTRSWAWHTSFECVPWHLHVAHVSFQWKCQDFEIHELQNVKFLGTNSNSSAQIVATIWISICTVRERGICVSWFVGFWWGKVFFSGEYIIRACSWFSCERARLLTDSPLHKFKAKISISICTVRKRRIWVSRFIGFWGCTFFSGICRTCMFWVVLWKGRELWLIHSTRAIWKSHDCVVPGV